MTSARLIQHVRVNRLIFSEKDRVGIGTFQPKDEKNQDSTELTGDINYRKIAEYGSDSDPRAFNFDGEFNIANRGIIEFVEVLKLDVAFLYDLLGASQEHKIKPKKFAQTDIDEVIIGHTNEPEYKKLQNNEFMEALRDRTVKIDIPYITKLAEEKKIYEKDFNARAIKGKHIAPHTLEMAAMWAVLTRLEEPKKHNLTAAAEAQALQRQDAAQLHRGQHQGAPQGGLARGHGGHQPPLRPGQDHQRPGERQGRGLHQPLHGAQRAGGGPEAPQPHLQRRDAEALPRAAHRREAGVRGHRQERGPAGDQRRRGRDRQALRQLHRQHQGLHPEGEGPEQVHRPLRGARRAADAEHRGEDRHPREPQGRLPPRDHELHRRARRGREDVQLPDQRAAAQGAGAEALRGPEGHHQAEESGQPASSTRRPRRRSTWSRTG